MDPARELRELRRIERRLTADDPALAATLSALGAKPRKTIRQRVLVAVGLLGVFMIVVGALTSDWPFLVVGVLVAATGTSLHVAGNRRARRAGWRD